MAATLRGQTTGYESANPSIATVAGDLIVVCLRERDGSGITVSDNVNGAYSTGETRAVNVARTGIWYFANCAGGTVTVTVAGGSVRDFNVSVWSGVGTGAKDTSAQAGSGGTLNHQMGSVTPSAAALIVTACGTGANGGMTLDAAFTAALDINVNATANRQFYAYKVSAPASTINPTHVSAASCAHDGVSVVFLESGGGGGGVVGPLLAGHVTGGGILAGGRLVN